MIRNYQIRITYDDGTDRIVVRRAMSAEHALSRALWDAINERDGIAASHRLGEIPPEGLRLVEGVAVHWEDLLAQARERSDRQ